MPITHFARSIFRAYDIRGRVPDELNEELIYWIGRVLGSEVRSSNDSPVCIGSDGRLSAAPLRSALIRGVRETGVDVLDLGYAPTPLIYFAAHQHSQANALVLTASHNPPDQNGLKVMIKGETWMDSQITSIADRITDGPFAEGAGKLIEQDRTSDYIHQLLNQFPKLRPRKLVVDTANGIAGPLMDRLLKRTGINYELLFSEVDGNFPNHPSDPCVEVNLQALKARLAQEKDALGVALDGDGDRIVLIDELGRTLAADQIFLLLAIDELKRHPDAGFLIDVKCSRRVEHELTQRGANVLMGRTGHAPMKRAMIAEGALMGAELSAHFYFREWYGFDDPFFTLLKVLSLLDREEVSLASLIDQLPKWIATPELRLECSEPRRVIRALEEQSFDDAKVHTLDGIRVEFQDAWLLARASNTESALVLRFEGDSQASLKYRFEQFKQYLDQIAPEVRLPELNSLIPETGDTHAVVA